MFVLLPLTKTAPVYFCDCCTCFHLTTCKLKQTTSGSSLSHIHPESQPGNEAADCGCAGDTNVQLEMMEKTSLHCFASYCTVCLCRSRVQWRGSRQQRAVKSVICDVSDDVSKSGQPDSVGSERLLKRARRVKRELRGAARWSGAADCDCTGEVRNVGAV